MLPIVALITSSPGGAKVGRGVVDAVGGATEGPACTPKKVWKWRMNAASRAAGFPGSVNGGRTASSVTPRLVARLAKNVCQSPGKALASPKPAGRATALMLLPPTF